eukprot:symbB.v1.2.028383.t2/scaffold2960.1/size66438/1
MAKVPVDQFHGEMQHGSFSTPSADLQSSDSCRVPGATDIKRLLKAKAAHQQRVKVVRARVQLLNAHEQQVWKDVKLLHQRGNNQAEFAQWQREVRKEEQLQLQRDVADYHEALKERARHVRASLQNTQAPRLEKYRENKMTAQQVREDSRRLLAALQEVREQSHQSKMMQVEVRKQQQLFCAFSSKMRSCWDHDLGSHPCRGIKAQESSFLPSLLALGPSKHGSFTAFLFGNEPLARHRAHPSCFSDRGLAFEWMLIFDSSKYHHKPIDFELGIGKVIPGWDEGIEGMRVGGKRRLQIPADLAYGERAVGKIPPNSTLVFDTELVDVKAPGAELY